MRNNRTRAVAILGLSCLLLSGALFAVLVYGITFKKNAISERAAAWAAAEERQKQLSSLLTLVSDTEADRARLAALVLTEESVIDFLSDIEGMARERGLSVVTRALNVKDLGEGDFEILVLSLEIGGARDAVTSMIALIETLPLQTVVRRVTFEQVEGDVPGWRALLDIEVTKYKKR